MGTDAPSSTTPGWLAVLLIVLVVVVGYALGPDRLPLHGEETRRAQFGVEMARNGDWVVATVQSIQRPTRPPLQYWLLAGIHKWVHELDTVTLRLSMAIVTLLTSLLVWWYAKQFLSNEVACLAGMAFATMGQVFELGRRVETDGLFAMLLAGSLLIWHAGYMQRWRAVWTWTIAGLLAALATLTKGTQGPVAFFGTIYVFLLLRRDWRVLLHWSHVVGLATFTGIVAIWQVPFYLREGWQATRHVWFNEISARIGFDLWALVHQLGGFPFEVLVASLPWSILALGVLHPSFWKLDGKTKSAVLFNLIGMLSIFGPVWVSHDGEVRYVMPMYPLLAVVCGAVIERALAAELVSPLRRFWTSHVRTTAVATAVLAAFFCTASFAAAFEFTGWFAERMAQPWWLTVVMVVGAAVSVTVVYAQSRSASHRQALSIGVCLSLLLATLFNGAILNSHARRTTDLEPQVDELRERILDESELVSFGPLHHRFVFFYETPIPICGWPETEQSVPADVEYFAVNGVRDEGVKLPFAWEPVATFSMDRTQHVDPIETVIVGRRIAVAPKLSSSVPATAHAFHAARSSMSRSPRSSEASR